MTKNKLVLSAFLFFFLPMAVSRAYVPEPQSEGKYFSAKGTKASETYERTAGMPIYEYGKGIQWGPVHFKPMLDYSFNWVDNVFYDQDSPESDYYHSLVAEMLAELPLAGGQHLLSGAYRAKGEWFDRFDDQDHTDQRGTVALKLNYVPFTLDVQDTYERTVSRADTEFTDRVQRDENAFHSLLEVPFASFFLENEITDFDISYDRAVDQAFNHNLFDVYQRVGYDLSPNTQILGEYAFINIDYDNRGDRNGEGHQYMLGLRGKVTERIAYQVWGGAQHRIYDEDIRPDFNGFVMRGALLWEPNELNQVMLRADRAPQESTFDDQSFYTRNRVALSWRRQIAERWFWNAQGAFGYHEYSRTTVVPPPLAQNQTREDTSWDAGTGLEYRMPNDIVSIVLNYRFASRDANLEGLDYEANEISAGVRASF